MINYQMLVQTVGIFLTAAAIFLSFLELKKISQSNVVSVIAHCAARYDSLMRELPAFNERDQMDLWWYRLWDLWTEEFYFVNKHALDKEIFRLWVTELTSFYHYPPRHMDIPTTQREAHNLYLNEALPDEKKIHDFFDEVANIARLKSPAERARAVKVLVSKL